MDKDQGNHEVSSTSDCDSENDYVLEEEEEGTDARQHTIDAINAGFKEIKESQELAIARCTEEGEILQTMLHDDTKYKENDKKLLRETLEQWKLYEQALTEVFSFSQEENRLLVAMHRDGITDDEKADLWESRHQLLSEEEASREKLDKVKESLDRMKQKIDVMLLIKRGTEMHCNKTERKRPRNSSK